MTTTALASTPATQRRGPRLTAHRLALALAGLLFLEFATGPNGVGEDAARGVVAGKLVALHAHYAAEGLLDIAGGLALVALAIAAWRGPSTGRRLLIAGGVTGALLCAAFGPMYLLLARAGATGYTAAYNAVPLRGVALELTTLASVSLGLVLAGLALRLRAAQPGKRPVLATIALTIAAADVIGVIPLPVTDALGAIAFFATTPTLALTAWRARRTG